jgi:RNA recognition motif-containing protein
VTSTLVKFDEKTKKPFAFVCFENSEAAKEAMEKYNNSKLLGEEPLFMNWAEKKKDRVRKLKEGMAGQTTKTNLFLKNLKENVTKEDLERVF